MSDRALLAAIVADPDDDTPRLVYADWLDEHGDPDRAEFIRVQCRLADLSPADPAWVDLTERQDELCARLQNRQYELSPQGPDADAFYFGSRFIDRLEEPFHRGFPFRLNDQTQAADWTPDRVRERADQLRRLFGGTTVRGLHVYRIPSARLGELLDALPSGALRAFAAQPHTDDPNGLDAEATAFYRVVADHPALTGVRHLSLGWGVNPPAADALVRATVLAAVRRVELTVGMPSADFARVVAAGWFRGATHARIRYAGAWVVPGLGWLPALHTLDLHAARPDAVPAFAAERFSALARLRLESALNRPDATALARAAFPRLTVFEPWCGMKADALGELMKADWFARLRVLDLYRNAVGDRGVAAVAAHPVAKTLRVFRAKENASGPTALKAIARPGAFPELTTLDLEAYRKRSATEAHLLAFASALEMPKLRHLNLHGWPLGDAGAVALAANPTLAGLTRLTLDSCHIGNRGAKALLASPHLQNLVELHLSDNPITTGTDALADPGVMPRLGECWLSMTKVPAKSAARIKATDRYVII